MKVLVSYGGPKRNVLMSPRNVLLFSLFSFTPFAIYTINLPPSHHENNWNSSILCKRFHREIFWCNACGRFMTSGCGVDIVRLTRKKIPLHARLYFLLTVSSLEKLSLQILIMIVYFWGYEIHLLTHLEF